MNHNLRIQWVIRICIVSALTLFAIGCRVSQNAVANSDPLVYIDGEVRNPGRYRWAEGMTINDVLEQSGGLTQFANRRRIQVVRLGAVQTVDLDRDIFHLKNSDVIHVKPRLF